MVDKVNRVWGEVCLGVGSLFGGLDLVLGLGREREEEFGVGVFVVSIFLYSYFNFVGV